MSPTLIIKDGNKEVKVDISRETLEGLWYAVRERYLGMSMKLNPIQSKELDEISDAIAEISKSAQTKGKERA